MLNCTVPNQTTWSQTKAYVTKSSCEFSTLLVYYAVLSDNSLPTFQDDLSVPSSRVKKSKREESMTGVNSQSFLLWDTVHRLILYRSITFQKLAVSFPGKEIPNLANLSD
jgi:hypothetical protein